MKSTSNPSSNSNSNSDSNSKTAIRLLIGLFFALFASLAMAACGSDGDDAADDEGQAEEQTSDDETASQSGDGSGVAASETTVATTPPQPELAVPALLGANTNDVTVGGYIFETDGNYVLCEMATDTDPPECEGESIEISNGDVIDPSIFLGEPGSQYSDAEVVVTGDVSDGILTIG